MDYRQLFTFSVLYDAYKTARSGKRDKAGTAEFEAHALTYIERLTYLLQSGQYRPGKFETFFVYEPKKRLVQAPAFRDKVVQHALVDNFLYEAITRSFIEDSFASQIGKGVHVGLHRLKRNMQDYFLKRKGHDEAARRAQGLPPRPPEEWNYADGWILKADVHHFFASINHDILKEKLKKRVKDPQIFNLLCVYIDSTAGLPLGYQTSQLLALMYLDDFDHWVKEVLHARYYGRYMDDFYIISDSKAQLQEYRERIEEYMTGLKLELNSKTAIFPLKNGINFLGFHTYLDARGGIVMKVRRDSVQRMQARIKARKAAPPVTPEDKAKAINSWRAWDAHAAHGDTLNLRVKIAAEVSAVVGVRVYARRPIRESKNEKAWKAIKQLRRTRRKAPAPPEPAPAGVPW